METTLGLFMDHKDYGGTNFAIFFFVSLKIMDLLYVVNLLFVWRGPISEVETDFFNWLLLVKSKIAVFVKLICSLPRSL